MPDRTPDKPPGFFSHVAAGLISVLERKAAPAMLYRHSARGGGSGLYFGNGTSDTFLANLPGGDRDVAADAGDLWLNSAVSACLSWLTDQCAEPFLEVLTLDRESGDYSPHPTHDLINLLESPNDGYTADALWSATVLSWQVSGLAYWIKARTKGGKVGALWFAPWWEIEPIWPDDGSAFLSGFRHTVDGISYDLPREDVVQFRRGLDPADLRRGMAPLGAVLREVATDNSAAAYESDILRNQGIIPVLVQPAEPGDEFAPGEAEAIKAQFQGNSTGSNRGRVIVSSARVDLKQYGLGPKDMSLGSIRYIPEDRICAATGVNAMVVGLSSGSVHKTYNNLGEATRAAYNRGLIPMLRGFARAITPQLLHAEFGGRPGLDYCEWNYDDVAALSEDATERVTRATLAFEKRLIKRGEACEIAGMNPPDPEFDTYLEQPSVENARAWAAVDNDPNTDPNASARLFGKPNDKPPPRLTPGGRDDGSAVGDGDADEPAPRLRIAKALANGDGHKSTFGDYLASFEAGTDGDRHESRHIGEILSDDWERDIRAMLRKRLVTDHGLTAEEAEAREVEIMGPFVAKAEREDDADPFSRLAGQVASLGERKATTPKPTGEANTYNLPDGKPISKELIAFFRQQLKDILGTIETIGAPLGDPATWTALPAIPTDLTAYDAPMAEAMTPLIGAYWDESGKRVMAKLGLDPDDWRVVDPNTRRMIEGAALAFSKSTNATTAKDLRTALDDLRRELAEGIVDRGESLPQLTKRVQSVFEDASKNRAKTIAETEASRAVHAAQLESARQSGVVWGKKLLLSSDACELCVAIKAGEPEHGWPLDAEMYNDGKGHPDYSSVPAPPLHVRCRCTYLDVIWEDAPPGVVRPDFGSVFDVGDEAAPEPGPAVEPRPTDPIGAARESQRAANRAAAAADPGYARLLERFPDLIPDGPIGERIGKYTYGEAKRQAILEIEGRLDVERQRIMDAKAEISLRLIDLDRAERSLLKPYDGKRVPKKVQAQAEAIQAEVKGLVAGKDALVAEQNRLGDRRRDEVLGIIGSGRGVAFGTSGVPDGYRTGSGPLGPIAQQTGENLATAVRWLESVVAEGDTLSISTRVGEGAGYRAHFHNSLDHMQLAAGQDVGTIVHEFGHAIDYRLQTSSDRVLDRSREFLAHRVGDETPVDLLAKFGKGDPGEKGRKDKFDAVFDEYSAYYVGKDYSKGSGGTEIVSMGLQLLYNDPVEFAKNDPEYFKFVLGILDSSLR